MSERREPEIDIPAIRAEAKRLWKEEHRRELNLLSIIESSVPVWLALITAVMYLLSSPHTAAIFDRLTPGWGWIAPVGVEFSLLYGAFRRKQAQQRQQQVPIVLWILVVLAFITAIIVNGAGAFMAVVSAVQIQALSIDEIAQQFARFPASTQVSLILVPIAAFIIPIGTSVTGEGLATLVFERSKDEDKLEKRWREVEYHILRKAFFEAYLQAGLKPIEAKRQAVVTASGFTESTAVSGAVTGSDNLVTGDDKPLTKRQKAKQMLRENPAWKDLPLRNLAEMTGIDHNTWSVAKKEFSENGNGHHS